MWVAVPVGVLVGVGVAVLVAVGVGVEVGVGVWVRHVSPAGIFTARVLLLTGIAAPSSWYLADIPAGMVCFTQSGCTV